MGLNEEKLYVLYVRLAPNDSQRLHIQTATVLIKTSLAKSQIRRSWEDFLDKQLRHPGNQPVVYEAIEVSEVQDALPFNENSPMNPEEALRRAFWGSLWKS